MKYTGVFVVLLILITGCANSQGSLFVVLEGGDNIKLTPDPIVTAGEINLVQSPEISGNLSVDGDMFIRGEIVSVSDIQVNDSFNVSGDLQVGSIPVLFVDSGSDRVGIGTTSPAGLLHLQTDDDLSFILKSGSSSNDDYRFVLDGGANTLAIGSTGHTSTLVLSGASGNVGIGTTSPQKSFVVSNGGVNGFEIDPTATSGTINNLISYNRAGAAYTGIVLDALNLAINTGSSPTTALVIDSSRNVGIGDTSPDEELDVESAAEAFIRVNSDNDANSADTDVGIDLLVDTGVQKGFWHYDQGLDKVLFGAGTTNNIALDADGNVGIGKTSPAESLHVSGNVNITGNLLVEGCIIYNGATGSPTTLGSCV